MTSVERMDEVFKRRLGKRWGEEIGNHDLWADCVAAMKAAVLAEREACAMECDRVYQRHGEAVRVCDTPDGHDRLKNRAGGAGECAVAIRARAT